MVSTLRFVSALSGSRRWAGQLPIPRRSALTTSGNSSSYGCRDEITANASGAQAKSSELDSHTSYPQLARRPQQETPMTFTIRSNSFSDGDYLANAHILSADFGFGCQGNNQSPHLAWSGAPTGTKSFARSEEHTSELQSQSK